MNSYQMVLHRPVEPARLCRRYGLLPDSRLIAHYASQLFSTLCHHRLTVTTSESVKSARMITSLNLSPACRPSDGFVISPYEPWAARTMGPCPCKAEAKSRA